MAADGEAREDGQQQERERERERAAADGEPAAGSKGRGGWRGAHVMTKRRALEKRVLDLFAKQPQETLATQGTVQWARFEKDSMRIPCVVVPATRLRSRDQLTLAKEALVSRRPTVVVFWLGYGSFGKVRTNELASYKVNGPDPNLETQDAQPVTASPSPADAVDLAQTPVLLEKNRAFLEVARAEADAAIEDPLAYVDRLNVLSTSLADESEDAVSTRSGRSSVATRRHLIPPSSLFSTRPPPSGPLHGVDPFEPDYVDRLGAHLARRHLLQNQHSHARSLPSSAIHAAVNPNAADDAHAFEDARALAQAQAQGAVDDAIASEGTSDNEANHHEDDDKSIIFDGSDDDDDDDDNDDNEDEYLPDDVVAARKRQKAAEAAKKKKLKKMKKEKKAKKHKKHAKDKKRKKSDHDKKRKRDQPPAPDASSATKRPKTDATVETARMDPEKAIKRLHKTKKKLAVFLEHPELASNEQAVDKAVELLKDLATFPITEPLLRETQIGPTIASLRTHEHEQVKTYARALRSVWKDRIIAQKEATTPSQTQQH